MKVLRRANGGVWGSFPGCFTKVVGCGVGFSVGVKRLCASSEMWVVEVAFVVVVMMLEDFVYVVSLIVVLALFWCFYLLISEIALC